MFFTYTDINPLKIRKDRFLYFSLLFSIFLNIFLIFFTICFSESQLSCSTPHMSVTHFGEHWPMKIHWTWTKVFLLLPNHVLWEFRVCIFCICMISWLQSRKVTYFLPADCICRDVFPQSRRKTTQGCIPWAWLAFPTDKALQKMSSWSKTARQKWTATRRDTKTGLNPKQLKCKQAWLNGKPKLKCLK